MSTGISWTDETWNCVLGCSRTSPGCDFCYAVSTAHRGLTKAHRGLTVRAEGGPDWTGEVRCLPERLDVPLGWRKPKRIFVNSMSDLFHAEVPDEFLAQVFAVMAQAHQHVFQVLTKRPQRMARWVADETTKHWVSAALTRRLGVRSEDFAPFRTSEDARRLGRAIREARRAAGLDDVFDPWPLPNVWLGVSIESDRYAWRADHLRATPAAVRFLSCEPLLGPLPSLDLTGIDYVIAGGESGPKARPMHPIWVRHLRDRCEAAGIPFHFKQRGAWTWDPPESLRPADAYVSADGRLRMTDADTLHESEPGEHRVWKVGAKAAGRLLDGQVHDAEPVWRRPTEASR